MSNSVIESLKVNSLFLVEDYENQNTYLDEQIRQLNDQISALEGVLDQRAEQMKERLEVKREELGGTEVVYGPKFNVHALPPDGNITDWYIDSTAGIIYEYEGIGWDSDPIIIDLNNKWNWTSTYLYQPLGDGGTFGLVARRNQLLTSKSINSTNKSHIEKTREMLP